MKPQTPAEGILLRSDHGDAKWYTVPCSCGCGSDHEVWIEADKDFGISIHTSTKQKTDFWTESVPKRYDIKNDWLQEFDWFWKDLCNGLVTRIKLTWGIWVHGYLKYESTTIMSKQQALNYSEMLKQAIKDVENFRKAPK